MNPSEFLWINNKPKEFAIGYLQEGLGWVHLQLVSPHDVEHSFQICEMITLLRLFTAICQHSILWSYVYAHEDRIHGVLISCTSIPQVKGHHCVAVYP